MPLTPRVLLTAICLEPVGFARPPWVLVEPACLTLQKHVLSSSLAHGPAKVDSPGQAGVIQVGSDDEFGPPIPILKPMLFRIFINEADSEIQCLLMVSCLAVHVVVV